MSAPPDPSSARAHDPSKGEGGGPSEGGGDAANRRRGKDRRAGKERRKVQVPVAVERRTGFDRRSLPDRRTEGRSAGAYELDEDTLEFIAAVRAWQQREGVAFPPLSDLVLILRHLGWEKQPR